jgi:hypothetical protein
LLTSCGVGSHTAGRRQARRGEPRPRRPKRPAWKGLGDSMRELFGVSDHLENVITLAGGRHPGTLHLAPYTPSMSSSASANPTADGSSSEALLVSVSITTFSASCDARMLFGVRLECWPRGSPLSSEHRVQLNRINRRRKTQVSRRQARNCSPRRPRTDVREGLAEDEPSAMEVHGGDGPGGM